MTAYGSSTVKRHRRTRAELESIDQAIVEAILADYPVTLRGVFYRVESAGVVDKSDDGYRLVGRQLLKLRRAGVVPYHYITDGTRWITRPTTHTDLDQMLADAATSYRRSLWHSQPVDVHIFTEKDAISGVILPVTQQWDVPLGVLRGFASESFAWSVARTIEASGKLTYVYQLGDHDPSGLDAWRDFTEKVVQFAPTSPIMFERLAVTLPQIANLRLPTRPTKRTDSRARGFRGESVEVDAIPARMLRQLVEDAITRHIEPEALRLTRVAEESERSILTQIANLGWDNEATE
ncbi:hypothetical protein ABZU32_20390 [Sphaerisporangium sp. NPDC005288]|uniref:hypothetical protein n=1 Tax=Sphaerisporangium sp. NPDC005288 TaxID=3155114 RepID=UPI0033B289DC